MVGKGGVKGSAAAASDPGSVRFLQEIKSLSRALYLDPNKAPLSSHRSLPTSSSSSLTDRRSISDGRSKSLSSDSSKSTKQQKPSSSKEIEKEKDKKKEKENEKEKEKKKTSSSSIWNWKPIRALSHLGYRRFDCRFSLHVHFIKGIPPAIADTKLAVHWRRTTDPAASACATRPASVVNGIAEFEETLFYCCSVYGSQSRKQNSAKYEPRQFLIYPLVDSGAPGLDLGRHLVDLTRLLPLDLNELEEEEGNGCDNWSTSIRLSGKARGASLSVSFGFSLVGRGSSITSPAERKLSDILKSKDDNSERIIQESSVVPKHGQLPNLDRTGSLKDVRVLREVLLSSKSEFVVSANVEQVLDSEKYETPHELDSLGLDATSMFKDVTEDEELITKTCLLLESEKGSGEFLELKPCMLQEPVTENEEKDHVDPEFMMTEQGIQVPPAGTLGLMLPMEDEEEDKCDEQERFITKLDELSAAVQGIEVPAAGTLGLMIPMEDEEEGKCYEQERFITKLDEPSAEVQGIELPPEGPLVLSITMKEDTEEGKFREQKGWSIKLDESATEVSNTSSDLEGIGLILEVPEEEDLASGVSLEDEEQESPDKLVKPYEELVPKDVESSCKRASLKSRSLSLDDATQSVASEFLSMLGIAHSPFGLSSDSDPESPRERLWKQFKNESLVCSGNDIFDIDTDLGGLSEDFDLSSMVQEAEAELEKAAEGMDFKSRAKMLEDAETEALMREWGLDEKAFQHSPTGSMDGFGSPIHLPPEEPLGLPPLGEGLGPFLQTKDGGFLRSMTPSLFRNSKHKSSLIMQVSCPIVVPAEMGIGVMEILQSMASVGIEKLSVQASKLMPLEDIMGKTLHQVAWEATPALVDDKRLHLLEHRHSDMELSSSFGASTKKNISIGLDQISPASRETGSEIVSLEDLAPLAMDKIEALSLEGLRIQSGISDEEAPSNIIPQSIGEFSSLEGKEVHNRLSLGMEGAVGLQLLDIKDSADGVDGIMGLCISLDEWMRLDSGMVNDEEQISDRTTKILAAHGAKPMDLISGVGKGDKLGNRRSSRKWGFLGNNFTVALMVQLRDPFRNYEPVGTPMLALVQVERVFMPPKPKIYSSVSEKGNSEQEEEETECKAFAKEEKNQEEESIPQFKISEVHIAGLKTDPGKRKIWGNPFQKQSGSRWLLAAGMGKSNKHPIMKSEAVAKPSQVTTTVQPGDTLWSISSHVHGTGAKWKELAALNPHIRNPNIIFPDETIRLR